MSLFVYFAALLALGLAVPPDEIKKFLQSVGYGHLGDTFVKEEITSLHLSLQHLYIVLLLVM